MAITKYNLPRLKGKIIAIDGPAGSGKSTTAKLLAEALGYQYLDTGAMYRALTLVALDAGVAPSDGDKLTVLAKNLKFEFKVIDNVNHLLINGKDVTEPIRSPEVTRDVSEVSAHKGVRETIVAKQRQIGKNGSIVVEGRDTTTVVFPNADIKVYLDGDIKVRAQRRLLDMVNMGQKTSLEEQLEDIQRRDEYDSNREHSPLRKAKDAVTLDTSNLNIEEQVNWIIELIKDRFK